MLWWLRILSTGAEIHGLVIKRGYDSIMYAANSLVAMYAKCRDIIGREHCLIE